VYLRRIVLEDKYLSQFGKNVDLWNTEFSAENKGFKNYAHCNKFMLLKKSVHDYTHRFSRLNRLRDQ